MRPAKSAFAGCYYSAVPLQRSTNELRNFNWAADPLQKRRRHFRKFVRLVCAFRRLKMPSHATVFQLCLRACVHNERRGGEPEILLVYTYGRRLRQVSVAVYLRTIEFSRHLITKRLRSTYACIDITASEAAVSSLPINSHFSPLLRHTGAIRDCTQIL